MHFLDIATILLTGLMIGNELCVSLFINPALWKFDGYALTRELARSLGRFMPFWYALCLILLGAEAFLHWHEAGRDWILAAAVLWIATIVYTLALLLPINNRIAKGIAQKANRQDQHKVWDRRHRLRIILLTVAMICLLLGVRA